MSEFRLQGATRITLLYVMIAGAWILLSDFVLAALVADARLSAAVQTYKGWGFVAITALLLYLERKRADDALRRREARLSIAFHASPAALLITALADGRILDANEAYCRMTGYARDDLVGRRTTELSLWADPADRQKITQTLAQTSHVRDMEIRFRTHSGQIRTMQASIEPIELQGKRCIVSFALDITERKRTEEALRESEARYRTLFENAQVGIYRTTPDGRILAANPALIQMLGYASFDELAGRNLEQTGFEPGYPRSRFKEMIERDGEIRGLESAWTTCDHSTIFVRENARAVEGGDGAILYYEGTAEDITERKRAEEAIQSLARFPSENPNPVLRIERGGALLYANEAGYALLRDCQLEVGRPAPSVLQAAASDALARQIGMTIDTQHDQRIISFFVAPVVKAGYANLYGRDVTERKRAEAQLVEQLDELRRWHAVTLGRETRLLDLKREVNELLARAGQPPRYPSAETENQ